MNLDIKVLTLSRRKVKTSIEDILKRLEASDPRDNRIQRRALAKSILATIHFCELRHNDATSINERDRLLKIAETLLENKKDIEDEHKNA
jgi:hypothetical protein